MQKSALVLAVAALFALPMSAFSQDDEGFGYHYGVPHHQGYHHRPRGNGQCEELRTACMHKKELGEKGQGNCQRYRQMCGRG